VIQKDDDKAEPDSTENKPKPVTISNEDLNTLAAIVATEAALGQEDDMEWVYINLFMKDQKGKSGLNESTPFRKKADTFKFNKFLLDDSFKMDRLQTDHFKRECRALKGSTEDKVCDGLKTIEDVLSVNRSYYVGSDQKRVNKIKADIVKKLNNPDKNTGFNSNGNLDDLNRNDGEWPKIRAFLRLQDGDTDGKIPVLIKKLGEGNKLEIVYKKDKIMDFFKDHPDKLPEKVPHYP